MKTRYYLFTILALICIGGVVLYIVLNYGEFRASMQRVYLNIYTELYPNVSKAALDEAIAATVDELLPAYAMTVLLFGAVPAYIFHLLAQRNRRTWLASEAISAGTYGAAQNRYTQASATAQNYRRWSNIFVVLWIASFFLGSRILGTMWGPFATLAALVIALLLGAIAAYYKAEEFIAGAQMRKIGPAPSQGSLVSKLGQL